MLDATTTPLDFALEYARAGYRVIPVKARAKVPLTEHGAHDSTNDPEKIRAWFARWPDANIGLTLEGLVVVDVDPRNGGDVELLPEKLPDTCTARTGGNGWHYLMRAGDGEKYASHPARGIDVKSGPGAYIVVEPSIHESGGRYSWIDESEPWALKPAEAPNWLAHGERKAAAPLESTAVVISEGARNVTLTKFAGTLRRAGLLEEEMLAALKVRNATLCRPPLDERDVRTIAASIAKKPPGATESWPAPLDLEYLAQREPDEPAFIMPGIPRGYLSANFGHGGIGKSFIEFIRTICIAAGRDFCGLPVTRVPVLYLAAEDRWNILHWRMVRVCRALGLDLASLRGWFHVVDLVGRDSVIYQPNASGGFIRSPYESLTALIASTGAEFITYDGIFDFFAGHENDRAHVKQFVNLLVGAATTRAPVVASMGIGHVSKLSARAGSNSNVSREPSGSTQWHNAPRSRWATVAEDEESEGTSRTPTGRILLTNEKANHAGKIGVTLVFEWNEVTRIFEGREVDRGIATGLVGAIQRNAERCALLDAIRAISTASYVPASDRGRNTAWHALHDQAERLPEALRGSDRATRNRIMALIAEMQRDGTLVLAGFVQPNRHIVNIVAPPDMVSSGRLRRIQGSAPNLERESPPFAPNSDAHTQE